MEVAMLERFFLKPQTVDRIMGCWLGPRIELYVMALCEQGYSARSIIRRVPILTEFAEFAAARHADRVDRAETLLDAFVVDWLSARRLERPADARRRDRNLVRGTVRHFFSLVVSKCDYHPDKAAWADPFAGQVSGFFEYLREERGLRPSSIHHYQHYLRRFERYLDQVGCSDLGALALPVITGFITASAQEFGSRAMVCVRSVRCWLAFSLAPVLRSIASAAGLTRFCSATSLLLRRRSDFSCPCIIGFGSSPSRCGPLGSCACDRV
jgi:integrase/recombinase XerD